MKWYYGSQAMMWHESHESSQIRLTSRHFSLRPQLWILFVLSSLVASADIRYHHIDESIDSLVISSGTMLISWSEEDNSKDSSKEILHIVFHEIPIYYPHDCRFPSICINKEKVESVITKMEELYTYTRILRSKLQYSKWEYQTHTHAKSLIHALES